MQINEFIEALKELNIEIDEDKLKKLENYYKLLIEWNEKINLTGITEKKDVYLKHFYDSLTLNKYINLKDINSLCDIGTGAGFPGIVLKIVFPNIHITLVDSLNKRIIFLKEVINKLELKDIEVYNERAEEYAKKVREKFDLVTCRAVARLPILLEYSIPLVKVGGVFAPLKANIDSELINIDKITQYNLLLFDNNYNYEVKDWYFKDSNNYFTSDIYSIFLYNLYFIEKKENSKYKELSHFIYNL